jgi:hypothetical protein
MLCVFEWNFLDEDIVVLRNLSSDDAQDVEMDGEAVVSVEHATRADFTEIPS